MPAGDGARETTGAGPWRARDRSFRRDGIRWRDGSMVSRSPSRRRRSRHASWMAALMLVASALLPGSAAAASDSQGSEFWLAFAR